MQNLWVVSFKKLLGIFVKFRIFTKVATDIFISLLNFSLMPLESNRDRGKTAKILEQLKFVDGTKMRLLFLQLFCGPALRFVWRPGP
jgi:hypothetical protein